jgi:hypothetical protein
MKKLSGALVATTPLLLLVAMVLVQGAALKEEPLQRIASYKQWTRVTPKILEQSISIDGLSVGG